MPDSQNTNSISDIRYGYRPDYDKYLNINGESLSLEEVVNLYLPSTITEENSIIVRKKNATIDNLTNPINKAKAAKQIIDYLRFDYSHGFDKFICQEYGTSETITPADRCAWINYVVQTALLQKDLTFDNVYFIYAVLCSSLSKISDSRFYIYRNYYPFDGISVVPSNIGEISTSLPYTNGSLPSVKADLWKTVFLQILTVCANTRPAVLESIATRLSVAKISVKDNTIFDQKEDIVNSLKKSSPIPTNPVATEIDKNRKDVLVTCWSDDINWVLKNDRTKTALTAAAIQSYMDRVINDIADWLMSELSNFRQYTDESFANLLANINNVSIALDNVASSAFEGENILNYNKNNTIALDGTFNINWLKDAGVYRVIKENIDNKETVAENDGLLKGVFPQMDSVYPPLDDWTGYLVIHQIAKGTLDEKDKIRVRQVLYPDDTNNQFPWTRTGLADAVVIDNNLMVGYLNNGNEKIIDVDLNPITDKIINGVRYVPCSGTASHYDSDTAHTHSTAYIDKSGDIQYVRYLTAPTTSNPIIEHSATYALFYSTDNVSLVGKDNPNVKITWSDWSLMGGGLRRIFTGTSGIKNADGIINAEKNVVYDSYSNDTIYLPNPNTVPIGTKIGIVQHKGNSVVSCSISNDLSYEQVTEPEYAETDDGNIDTTKVVTSKEYMFECCYNNTNGKDWVLDIQRNDSLAISKLRKLAGRREIYHRYGYIYENNQNRYTTKEFTNTNNVDDEYSLTLYDHLIQIDSFELSKIANRLELPRISNTIPYGAKITFDVYNSNIENPIDVTVGIQGSDTEQTFTVRAQSIMSLCFVFGKLEYNIDASNSLYDTKTWQLVTV